MGRPPKPRSTVTGAVLKMPKLNTKMLSVHKIYVFKQALMRSTSACGYEASYPELTLHALQKDDGHGYHRRATASRWSDERRLPLQAPVHLVISCYFLFACFFLEAPQIPPSIQTKKRATASDHVLVYLLLREHECHSRNPAEDGVERSALRRQEPTF